MRHLPLSAVSGLCCEGDVKEDSSTPQWVLSAEPLALRRREGYGMFLPVSDQPIPSEWMCACSM